ncbi:hypothetical protein MMC34_003518 [Xylographa carneopallida]|nr:hypothetical protein [Xylographa carneopallida]
MVCLRSHKYNASHTGILPVLLSLLSLIPSAIAANVTYVTTTDAQGQTVYLPETRQPALYTQNFGDCLGGSLLDISRFDAAYYQDNMTVIFHLQGSTQLTNASVMMYIAVYAYGESRFDLTFDPCNANIFSLCPTNASVPILASGIIPVSESDVAGIPPIALSIPDFEGQAILRIFDNATESEIGCFSAVVTNGNSFSQPASVGTVLGVFALVALVSSFATAVYGDHIPTLRTHYAHSLSIFVVFAVFHHIFFTGALSMNWPSVLPAWWSNFAWSAGMIYSPSIQASINKLIGSNGGNTSFVGADSLGSSSDQTGGGYSIASIYRRSSHSLFGREPGYLRDVLASHDMGPILFKRQGLENSTTGFDWYGYPVTPGLPLPGNFSGFAGTLAEEGIPASNAFMTGFLWLLILMVFVAAAVGLFKWTLEGLNRAKLIKTDRLVFFREHWLGYTAMAILRIMFIAFFMIMFLSLFQFVYRGSGGVTALAAIVFLVFFVGMLGAAVYACYYRIRFGKYSTTPDRLHLERTKALGFVPWYGFSRESRRSEKMSPKSSAGSLPWWRISYDDQDPQRREVHEDEDYIKNFGWLSARFRRTKWWFFSFWLIYEFIRACFYGAAAGEPLVQVFGLLVVEFIAFVAVIFMRPFEGARLNALMVYVLGFSKVSTVALSAAFDAHFSLPRITTTAIGIVIIVIQGILTILLMIAIIVGAISTYMSLTRNREHFSPQSWTSIRAKYFKHIEQTTTDRRAPPPPPPEEPKAPYFNVGSVRRVAKIEDEDDDQFGDKYDPFGSHASIAPSATPGTVTNRASRADSTRSNMSHSNLPFGARPHRTSWNSRDFANWHEAGMRRSSVMSRDGLQNMRSDPSLRETYGVQPRSRAPSRGNTYPLEVMKPRGNGKEREREPVVDEEAGPSKAPNDGLVSST